MVEFYMELWKPLSFNSSYSASTLGRIKSNARVRVYGDGRIYKYPDKILKPAFNKANRTLHVSIGGKSYYVHRLVACTFIPNPDDKPEVNHKDGDRRNNTVGNLEWVTKTENIRHSIINGWSKRPPVIYGEDRTNAKLSPEDVLEICRLCGIGNKIKEVAQQFSVSAVMVYEILGGRVWSRTTGILPKPKSARKRISEEEKIKIQEMYTQGMTQTKIARDLGFSQGGISNVLISLGIRKQARSE